MQSHLLLTWSLVALIGVLTPGIDVMMVLRTTIFSGRRPGVGAVAGVQIGCLIWATASLAGLTALLAASTLAYDVVRIGGACYLIWLGGTAIWRSLPRNRNRRAERDEADPARALTSAGATRRALLSNLLNPKVGVFYISILPQFLPTGSVLTTTSWGVVLVAIHVGLGIAWLGFLVLIASRARGVLTRAKVKAWLDRTSAAVMIGLGIRLATEHR